MPIENVHAIPGAYDGREQALIKHTLLENYLLKLFLIVGMAPKRGVSIELCYVDCFAGPWGDETEEMGSTSIAISLRTLDVCRQRLGIAGVATRFRALYIEKDSKAFARLSKYLNCNTPSGIKAEALNGDFVELQDEILRWAGPDPFTFFFIDPTGWKEIGVGKLQKLLTRPRSEFLINFMYDFINRTVSMREWQVDMAELLGELVNVDGLSPGEREHQILRTYRANLKRCVPASRTPFRARTAYVRVLDRTRDRPKYHLVYLTSHPRGVITFMEISEEVDLVQKQVRAVSKGTERAEQSGMADMFGVQSMINRGEGHASPDAVDGFWLQYLSRGSRAVGRNEFADILEDTDWFPSDLQASLARLIKRETLVNLDAQNSRPRKPLHFEVQGGERLQLKEARR